MAIATGAIAVLQISVAISLAALIFAGPLSPALPTAAGAFILSAAIASIVIGWKSSFEGLFAGSQDTAGVVVATVVGPATVALSGETRTMTAVVIVAISTLVVGVVFFLLGRFQLGSLVRYIPQPVVGGFIGGTGWLMLRGGVEVMVNRPIPLNTLAEVLDWSQLQLVLPGLALAGFIVTAVARSFTPIAISIAVVFAAFVFYVAVAVFSNVEAAEAGGWLIGPFSSSARWNPITPNELGVVDWGTVVAQTPAFGAIAVISVVGLLLNLTALEAVVGEDIDFDKELRLAGGVNLVGGVLGSLAAWHRIGGTVLAHHLKAKNRVAPVAVGVIGLLVMAGGSGIIELIPRVVAGGVLAGLGLALLWGWVMDYVVPGATADRALGLGILIAIAVLGPLMGVALGIMVAVGLFVVQYSRIDPVRHSLSGNVIRSTVDRAAHVQALLAAKSDSMRIIILDGYLFFGSATRAVESLREDSKVEDLTSLIVDLERVIGMDVSAATALAMTMNRIASQDVTVVVSGANPSVKHTLHSRDLDEGVGWCDTLDEAVEAIENNLLAELQVSVVGESFVELLSRDLSRAEDLLAHCTRVELDAGEFLIRAGIAADSLYFIEQGELSVTAPSNSGAQNSGTRRRLRKTSAGAVLGEVAFATGGERTADVIADTTVVAHQLTRASLESLRSEDPELTADFQSFLMRLVASQLRAKIETIDELLR